MRRGRAERWGDGWAAPGHRDPGFGPPFAVGAEGPHYSSCACSQCPANIFLEDLQISLLCNSTLVWHEQASKATSCTIHLCFMYRVESNQRSRIQITSVNAFDLRRYAITQEHGAGTPLTRFNATVAVCPAGISERSMGPDLLLLVCTGTAPLMSLEPIVKPIVRNPL